MLVSFEMYQPLLYAEGLSLQQYTWESVWAARLRGTDKVGKVLLCEHQPVYTLGKHGNLSNMLLSEAELKARGIDIFFTERGGDITFHGWGQLVVYPILDLERLGLGVRRYVWLLEECIIHLLRAYGITAARLEGAAGVWLQGQQKICAIGIKCSRSITLHGLALNINTDLQYFSYINPCGYTQYGVSSMADTLGRAITLAEIVPQFKASFLEIFGLQEAPNPAA